MINIQGHLTTIPMSPAIDDGFVRLWIKGTARVNNEAAGNTVYITVTLNGSTGHSSVIKGFALDRQHQPVAGIGKEEWGQSGAVYVARTPHSADCQFLAEVVISVQRESQKFITLSNATIATNNEIIRWDGSGQVIENGPLKEIIVQIACDGPVQGTIVMGVS